MMGNEKSEVRSQNENARPIAPLDAAAMSIRFRSGLGELAAGREGVKLRPNELRLAYQLCLETLDAGAPVGRILLDAWAKQLDLKDSKGYRPDKAGTLLNTLNELGIVDVNAAQATFEPRPDADLWLRARTLRARAFSSNSPAAAELALRDERLLPESLNELSRERALSQSSDKFDDRRINPTRVSSDKSDDAVQRLTFNRSNVETNKRLTFSPSDKSDDGFTAKVRRAVREFVGEHDWHRYWARAGYVWESRERVECLEGSLGYFAAGVASGEVEIKTTRGAALWSQAQIDWRKHQSSREAANNNQP